MDVEKAGLAENKATSGVVTAHEGVGDPFTYRGRTGRFSAYEWAVQIVLPILVVLLGAPTILLHILRGRGIFPQSRPHRLIAMQLRVYEDGHSKGSTLCRT